MELSWSLLVLRCEVFVLLLLVRLVVDQVIIRQEYHTQEEGGAGVLIGNAGKDSGLYDKFQKDFQKVLFKPFEHGNDYISYFSVDSSNGVIRTAKNLDRETICPTDPICSVKLSIPVYSSPAAASPILDSVLEVVIFIDDINDKSPTFPNRVVNLSVPENQPINYQVETSVATDEDAPGDNSRITYRLDPAIDVFELSTVRTADGVEDLVITVKKVLDRETRSHYQLKVVATDLGKEPKSGTVLINVYVADMNDNAPVFGRLNYSVNILENSDVTNPVVIVSASDQDEGNNSRLSYALSAQVSAEIQNTFVVEQNTGKIFTRRELDFETKKNYQFHIVVSDNGSPPKSNFAYVTVNLIDVNDNPPVIQVNQALDVGSVVENGAVGKFLAFIKVSDADSGLYGKVSCRIDDSNFILEAVDDSSVGIYKIKLNQMLDREEAPTRNVVITCQDGDVRPLSASATLSVPIEDVNDNSPKFVDSKLSGTVMENGKDDMYIMQIETVDPDMGENSRVTYAISGGRNASLFAINQTSGAIYTTRMLDREIQSEYLLEITASDHGAQPLASSATATIKVLDENDNPPKFRKQAFLNSIKENLPAGSPAGDVSAYDADTGDNAKFNFSIVSQGPGADDGMLFTVDPMSGLLKSEVTFDREGKRLYSFQVKVADPAVSTYFDIANVTVTIEDDNDHAPVVVKPPPSDRTFRCPFNLTVGSVITTFVATDQDDPRLVEISFYIQNKETKKPLFSIDPTSGKLRLARQIRPEDVTTYSLNVVVKDGVGPSSRSTVVAVSITVEEGSEEAMRAFSEGSKTNMVIVIIIIAATLVLAFIVIIVICLIRRVDKKRHAQSQSSVANMDNKLYQAAQWVSTVSVTNDHGPEEIRSTLEVPGEKKKKKEVSFSLEDEVVESPDTSGSICSVFSSLPNPAKGGTKQVDFIVLNGMTTPDYSQHLYDANSTSTDHQDERQFMEVRQTEDRYSDASSGDTGTSDSGRGCSEDESHGHTNSSVDGGKLINARKLLLSSSPANGVIPVPVNRLLQNSCWVTRLLLSAFLAAGHLQYSSTKTFPPSCLAQYSSANKTPTPCLPQYSRVRTALHPALSSILPTKHLDPASPSTSLKTPLHSASSSTITRTPLHPASTSTLQRRPCALPPPVL
ncbi:unnamed protein product [Candidula unifasciata]|uniref:Cadherin domain-containing protein n=1 Tax=Candidula unifasciata TaxID=100452 RepID=A0A8S3Z0Y5_9EUPU|nr:unnamed protein product [Candidula unifasciata]